MKIDLILGRRVFQNSLVIATTLATCAALQANEHENKPYDKAHKEHADKADKGGPLTVESFVKKATAGGQMEVQMGQIGQQQGQNQEVKALAAALVKDHTQANQKLQQIASTKNISSTHDSVGDQSKHQKHLDKLKNASGAEFDKEFVRMALKHHKKDIAEFERAQKQLNDQELKSFISETLPKLRQHYQMAKAAARTVGVDEATIAADIEDNESASGAAAGSVSGSEQRQDSTIQDRPRSSLDGATDTDASGTINQNDPSLKVDGQIGDRELSATADADADAEVNVDTESDGEKIFQKGDGKVLGLPTDKEDGKFLGVIPNPRADKDADVEVEADVDTDTDDTAVGGAASTESGSSKKDQ